MKNKTKSERICFGVATDSDCRNAFKSDNKLRICLIDRHYESL